jgi:histidyl-tRNA synthetase
MSKKIISNQSPRGTNDWFPEELALRRYIFETWRRVCLRYGFFEYLTPLIENAEIYRAKSGEDIGGQELLTFKDLGGRELCIRPEMTPSVTRMVSKIYASAPKPLKLFSIANFMRNEKPQRGRNREFWQLNCDIFGSASIAADLEILQLSLDIMRELKAPENSFILYLNSRRLLEAMLPILGLSEKKGLELFRILDKYEKLSENDFFTKLRKIGLKEENLKNINSFMSGRDSSWLSKLINSSSELKSAKAEIDFAIDRLSLLGYGQEILFKPSLIRGFDYYDGLVFEVFDKHSDNSRAMFGGGRYNGLAEIFGGQSFPAVGFAPGDETTKLFLETWDILPSDLLGESSIVYFPLLDSSLLSDAQILVSRLRRAGDKVLFAYEPQRLGKALDLANKKGYSQLLIFGLNEKEKNIYKLKDMKTGEEKVFSL